MKIQQLAESAEGAGMSSLEPASQTPPSQSFKRLYQMQSCRRNEPWFQLPGSASETQQLPETRARQGSFSSNSKATSGCLKSIFNSSIIFNCSITIKTFKCFHKVFSQEKKPRSTICCALSVNIKYFTSL